jgi:hypothetical protein
MSRHQEQARRDFDRAYRGAMLGNLLARLCRRPNNLLAYHEARRGLAVVGEGYRGVRTVPVEEIVGSTDRCGDFDRAFRPLRTHAGARWMSVARARAEGKELPPVQLYRVGDAYFVRDGHHRVSVARVRDQGFVDAEVVELVVRGPVPAEGTVSAPRADAGGAVRRPRTRLRRLVGLVPAWMDRWAGGLRQA